MGLSIGIDLGTRSLRAAFVARHGEHRLLTRRGSAHSIPAAVSMQDKGIVVGAAAMARALSHADRTIVDCKRLLGKKLHCGEIEWLSLAVPCPLSAAPNGDVCVVLGGRGLSPQELTSFLLEELKHVAEAELGEEVNEAVIGVPAMFDHRQRRALLDAAALAGFTNAALVNEVTAVALALSIEVVDEPRRIAVMDLGAGSFDAGLVEVCDGSLEVRAAAGDSLLGGSDLDLRVALHLAEACAKTTGYDPRADGSAMARLLHAARDAKHLLTDAQLSPSFDLPALVRAEAGLTAFRHAPLARGVFDDLVREEIEALADPCAWMLEDAGFGTDDIDELIVIGGTGRVPAFRHALERMFRTRVRPRNDGDQLVAIGAAYLAAGRHGRADVSVQDRTTLSFGLKVPGERMSRVVPRNHIIPCQERSTIRTARFGQSSVVLDAYQGESELCPENVYLGSFGLEHLDAVTTFVVSFRVDSSGVLGLSAADHRTGADLALSARPSGGLSEAELTTLRAERTERRRPAPVEPAPSEPAPPSGRVPEHRPPASLRRPPVGRSRSSTLPAPESEPPIAMGADSLVGSLVGGRYRIERIIADGGMGRVYLARHALLDKPVALKVLHPELAANRELAERFVREAQAASTIRSEYVVGISDFGALDDGTGYFVMDYLAGQTLEALMLERGRLSPMVVRLVGFQLAEGLHAAHSNGIVHRDLKPANVRVAESTDGYLCKILDFGIAKMPTTAKRGRLTLAGVLVGTPHYMSPEQIEAGEVDARADIYALGVVMYEMATGHLPFDGPSIAAMLTRHMWELPARLRSRPELDAFPEMLEDIILKCLRKDPAARYQTALAVAEDLAACEIGTE